MAIFIELSAINYAEKGVNAFGELITPEQARKNLMTTVREIWLAFENQKAGNLDIPRDELEEGRKVLDQYLEEAKKYYEEMSTASEGKNTFNW